jgi:hypothetical protein
MAFYSKLYNSLLRTTTILIFCLLSISTSARATSFGISGGVESFHLKEIGSTGTRLVSETGNRFVATALFDNYKRYESEIPLLYHLEASVYLGQVNYDGQSQSLDPAQNNLPVRSQTDYQGGRAEALLGYRFNPSVVPRGIELLGGLGVDSWNRRIQDGTASNGTQISGIKETYRAYYGKAAVGFADLFSPTLHSHLLFGIKMPLNINEEVNLSNLGYDNDVSVSPGNTYSGFIYLVLEPQSKNGSPGNMIFSAYYDGFRFDPSKSKTATRNGSSIQIWQPETHIDVFGVQIGYRF